MKVKDGVIMINFWPNLISCSNNSTIDQVVDHILHVIQVAGSEHVGFGADYDGIDTKTNGLEDVSKYPLLIRRMLERGIPEHEVVGIMGQNLIRVLKKTEMVADSLKHNAEDGSLLNSNKKKC
jgi:membrane dipeptidase